MKSQHNILWIAALALSLLLPGCQKRTEVNVSGHNIFEQANFIEGYRQADSSIIIKVVNPWDTNSALSIYHLSNQPTAATAQEGIVNLRVPFKRLIVFSAVHAALIAELGYADAIVGVADAEYIKTPAIRQRLDDGRIADIGNSLSPSLEKTISLHPDAILISPFQNSGHGIIDKANIPVIECADYMENTPLGRAEWSRFYTMLLNGISAPNDSLYRQVEHNYRALCDSVENAHAATPLVITELPQGGNWLVPGGDSYIAHLIEDAGGKYIFADNHATGSVPMSYEAAYSRAKDADFWLIKTLGDPSMTEIEENNPLNAQFKALGSGGVYNANTSRANLYEETPFHPDLLLRDFISIFHRLPTPLRYYQPVK